MANVFRPYIKVTGGTSDALDGETQMIEGDTALVSTLDGNFYIYVCRNSAAAASAPSVVQPVNVTSDLRWHLAHVTTQGSEHWAASVGGTANAITLSFAPAFTSVPVGVPLYFRVGSANTGSVSIAVDSLTAITAKKSGSLDIAPGDFAVGSVICIIYDGTNFQVIGVSRYRSEYYVAGGTANELTITCNPPLTAHIPGMPIYILITAANTGPMTLAVDALGPMSLRKSTGSEFAPGDLTPGMIIAAQCNNTKDSYMVSSAVADVDKILSRIGTAGPASYRNKLGNCNFTVNQLGTSFTLQPGTYLSATSDLWIVHNITDKPVVVTITADSWTSWEGRKINLIYFTAQAQPTSGSVLIAQRIENCNTLAGKAACLSYLAATPGAGVPIPSSWTQNFGSGGSSAVSGSFGSTPAPGVALARYSTTAKIGDTSGKTIGAGNYLQITLDIPIRSINGVFIGLPQLEEGNTPSPVEFVEDWVDWARCLRRYWGISNAAMPGYLDTASSAARFIHIPFPVPMRCTPSIAATGNYTWTLQALTGSFVTLTGAVGNSNNQAVINTFVADARL